MKSNHMVICALLVIAGVVLLSTGAGALAAQPLLLAGR